MKKYMVESLIECLATCILILIGESAIANYKFTRQTSHSTFPIAFAFGVGVYGALMIAGSITGGHINPAVSISLMTIKKLKPVQCLFYVVGQILGAFLGSSLVYLVFSKQFDLFDGGLRQIKGENGTADIFFTIPSKGLSHWDTLIDQIVSTGLLMIYIMALTNNSNKMISEVVKPFAFLLFVMGITLAFSINAGAAINPARDLGPRLFSSFLYGWKNVFCMDDYYFLIPIFGPIIGGIIGVWIYTSFNWIVKTYGQISDSEDNDQQENESNDVKQKLTATKI